MNKAGVKYRKPYNTRYTLISHALEGGMNPILVAELSGKTCVIPVHVGQGIPDILLGLRWQNQARITVDYRAGILTLELEA